MDIEAKVRFEIQGENNEDAFRAANEHAADVVNLTNILLESTPLTAPFLVEQAQKSYEKLFEAFIAGVDYGRKKPNPKT